MAHGVVGREAELAAVESLLEEVEHGPAALVLDGEAGIGKTTVWLSGVEQARERGYCVLSCRPSEAEASLPFVALADLLEPLLPDALSALPTPQRRALEVALLLEDAEETRPDPRAIGAGLLNSLRQAARSRPVLLAIDDLQWLDPASAGAIEYAARRLQAEPAGYLLARRVDGLMPVPLALDRALPGASLRHREVGPLSIGALHRLLLDRLGGSFQRPAFRRIHETSGGNPFYALELSRALELRAETLEPGRPLPVPETLQALVEARLRALPGDVVETVTPAAFLAAPTVAMLEAASGSPDDALRRLREAAAAGVLELHGERVRFSHPLLASAVADRLGPRRRRALHRGLAEIVHDVEQRARHLALGAETPSTEVGRALDEAASRAAARGAPAAAAELAEHAARLTLPGNTEDEARRLKAAARHHTDAGDAPRARAILEELAKRLPPGPGRADVIWRVADLASDDLEEAVELCRKALNEAEGRPELEAEIELQLAVYAGLAYDLASAVAHCDRASEQAERAGDDRLLAAALAQAAKFETILGRPTAADKLARALELERGVETFAAFQRPSFVHGWILMLADEPERARALLHAELERLSAAGHEATRAGGFFPLVELELRTGDWATAERSAREAVTLAEQASVDQELGALLVLLAHVSAHLGRVAESRDAAERALRRADDGGDMAVAIRARGALGFLELSLGEPGAAAAWLGPAVERLVAANAADFSSYNVVQNQIDALVALGDLERAGELVALVERKGQLLGRAWHAAVAARGRAQLAAAGGDFRAARAALEQAFAAHERLPQPFELGRTLLVQGTIERRAKRRRTAREALTRALELFDDLGAPLWAERVAAELARVPGRAPSPSGLSPTERRVAELVASGLSNREVAARLFVTVRAVEKNLSSIYAKLGVRSRTELAARLSRQADS